MNIELISSRLLQVTLIVTIIWNVIAVLKDPSGTLSKVILSSSMIYPSIPIMLGFMLGHMMWPMYITNEYSYWIYTLPLAVAMLFTIVIVDFTIGLPRVNYPIIYLILTMPLGHFLWPQKLFE